MDDYEVCLSDALIGVRIKPETSDGKENGR